MRERAYLKIEVLSPSLFHRGHERGSRVPASEETVCLTDLAVFYRSPSKAAAGPSNSDKYMQFSLSG